MVEKTQFSDTDLKIEILKKGEDLTGFTCGNKTLDDFFHQEVNNPKTNKFYMNNGFLYQTNEDFMAETRRMFLSLIEYIE